MTGWLTDMFKLGVKEKIFGALLCLFTAACVVFFLQPSQAKVVEPEIVHTKLGNSDLYIPKPYLRFGHTSIGPESILMQAWYPGSDVVPGQGDNLAELWQQGEGWKSVRILMSKKDSSISFDEFFEKSTGYLEATELVGLEYGLIHKTQPQGAVKDKYDVWHDEKDGKILSHITCSEKITPTSRPQCSQFLFISPDVWMMISYHKELLPEWRTVQENVISLWKSFSSEKNSREFISARMRAENDRNSGQ